MQLITHELPFRNTIRRVRVLLPKNYTTTNVKYPVIYFHDGQNIFYDHESYIQYSWRVIQALTKLKLNVIVVAIDTSDDRFHEMAAFPIINEYRIQNDLAIAKQYELFCVDTLIPFVNENYRVLISKKYTALIGSSLGGCFTQYLGMKYSHIFGCLGIFSAANFIFDQQLFKYFENYKDKKQHFYIQVGGSEGSKWDIRKGDGQRYLDTNIAFYRFLIEKKVPLNHIYFTVTTNGKHSEKVWSKCLVDCLSYFNDIWKTK